MGMLFQDILLVLLNFIEFILDVGFIIEIQRAD